MESGSKAASSDEAVRSSGLAVAAARDDDAAAVSVPAPAAPPSTRPYYECVFCKRGFTTAQALGGHMNMHRRDRAKPASRIDTPTGITSVSRTTRCYSQYRHLAYAPAPPATAPMSSGSGSSSSFAMLYHPGAAVAAGVDAVAVSSGSPSPRELCLFGADCHDHDLHLGLGSYGRGGDVSRAPEGPDRQDGEPERKLDLELRLGRRPRH